MTDQNKKGWFVQIITSIITSLAVLAGAWFAFQGDVTKSHMSADVQRLESAFKRIEHLENQMKSQQAKYETRIIELTAQVIKLQSQLDKNLNIMDMFENFIDGLPFPAWVKEVDENGDIKMLLVNRRYEYTHDITRGRYKGGNDLEIWGDSIAEMFAKSDRKVLMNKSSTATFESYPDLPSHKRIPDKYKKRFIVKVYLELIEGKGLIYGMAIPVEDFN